MGRLRTLAQTFHEFTTNHVAEQNVPDVANAGDLQTLLADKIYSWSDLREACPRASTRPMIKHCEQNALKKAHNARIDDEVHNQRSMSETVFGMLKGDGDELRSPSWHSQFRELTWECIVHNLTQAVS